MEKDLIIRGSSAEFLIFERRKGEKDIEVRFEDGDLWLTPKAISDLFDTSKQMENGIFFDEDYFDILKDLELIFPDKSYKEQILEYLKEFKENGEDKIPGGAGLYEIQNIDDWFEKINNDLNEDKCKENQRVPATFYLTIRKSDGKIVGNVQIRHRLNEKLLLIGGHIGDSVRPSERHKGYATEQIKLALMKCKELGIGNVLMTCQKSNTYSAHSIMNNGGILENEVNVEEGKEQQYWISLKKRYAYKYLEKYADNIVFKSTKIESKDFTGDIVHYKFENVNEKHVLPNGTSIIDTGYEWVEFYDYNSKIKLTAIYNEKKEIVEWYFDIARKIGKENGIPYEDDLYLDVVVNSNEEIKLIDEDELEQAFDRLEVDKKYFDIAYDEAYKLMNKLQGNVKKLKSFTDYYLNICKE